MRRDETMKRDGQTLRGNELDPGRVKAWAKRALSSRWIAVTIAKLVVAGYVGIALVQVVQTY